jgi:hypothetical protein
MPTNVHVRSYWGTEGCCGVRAGFSGHGVLNPAGNFAELPGLNREFEMIATDCPNCGEPVTTFAKSCAQCGAPNPARRAGFIVAASLVALLLAIGIATFAVVRWQRLPVTAEPTAPAATDDFAWLTAAMTDCDTEAAAQVSTLHFLVIPLSAASADSQRWRGRTIDTIGNAILLPSDDVLAALKGGALTISADQYVFSIRDETTNTVYKWSPSTGVKRFSTPNADAIEGFRVQFLSGDKSNADDWGSTFSRRKGNCYWVNALIGK